MRDVLDDYERELSARQLPVAARDFHIARVKRLGKAWRASRRQISLSAVVGPDGTAHSDPRACATTLTVYWGEVFSPGVPNMENAKRFLDLIPRIPDDNYQYTTVSHPRYPWVISPGQFHDLPHSRVDSAPGPDGLPYSVWQCGNQ
eukprot:832326-Pyramimonas_sp.AAC.1